MDLDLYVLHLIPDDMDDSVEFYGLYSSVDKAVEVMKSYLEDERAVFTSEGAGEYFESLGWTWEVSKVIPDMPLLSEFVDEYDKNGEVLNGGIPS